MDDRSPRFPNKLAVIGVFFVLAGGVLLLWTAGYLRRFVNLWPLLPVIGGLVLLYYRIYRNGRDYYIFLGTSLVLSGALLLVTTTAVPAALESVWPLFMSVIGIALLLYGLRKTGSGRVTFVVPGLVMILLSAVFLPFSLELVTADFVSFVGVWWPALLVVMGAALIAAHLARRGGE